MTHPRPRIYLAGPEVFLPDARAVGALKCRLCAEAGFVGVFPLDAPLALDGKAKHEQAALIAAGCEGQMRSCDLAIANLTPFRGVSADVGTAYEVGFMRGLGKPVLGYTNTTLDHERRARVYRGGTRLPFDADKPDVEIEDFGLSENLMIEIAIEASGSRLIRHVPLPGLEMADLAGFRLCLEEARRLVG